jgi:hypothetical protein
LVVANGVYGNVTGGCELLDAIPHDRQLYECSLEWSRLGGGRLVAVYGVMRLNA